MKKRMIIYVIIGLILLIAMVVLTGCDENVNIDFYEPCIYMMDADGSNLTKVIELYGSWVQFVPNNYKILFKSDTSLFTANFDGTGLEMITDTLKVRSEYPSISIDGEKVLFGAQNDIFIVNIDGTGIVKLTDTKDIKEKQPFLSPDKTEMIFKGESTTLKGETQYTICSMKLDEGIIDTLITSNTYLGWPSYSPDGEKIYYTRGGSNQGLYSMNRDGSNITKLVNEVAVGYPISISLNKLIYIYYPNIYIMNNDGSEIQDLGKGYEPHIAPFNDSKIVYSNNGFYDGDIYIMNNEGTEKRKIANYGYNARFSNDGTKIVFPGQYQTNKKGKNYIMN